MKHLFLGPDEAGDIIEMSEDLFRRVNRKKLSFGDVIDADVAAMVDFGYIEVAEPPAVNTSTHKLVPQARVLVSGNRYTKGWDVVPLSEEELDAIAQAYVLKLEQAKASKRAEINDARMAANNSHFDFGGKQIACDALSTKDINGVTDYVLLFGEFPAGFPGAWKALDNSFVMIPDVDTWKEFIKAMCSRGTVNFGRSEMRKAAINAATTLSQVNAVVW